MLKVLDLTREAARIKMRRASSVYRTPTDNKLSKCLTVVLAYCAPRPLPPEFLPSYHPYFRYAMFTHPFSLKCSFRNEQEMKLKEKDKEMER